MQDIAATYYDWVHTRSLALLDCPVLESATASSPFIYQDYRTMFSLRRFTALQHLYLTSTRSMTCSGLGMGIISGYQTSSSGPPSRSVWAAKCGKGLSIGTLLFTQISRGECPSLERAVWDTINKIRNEDTIAALLRSGAWNLVMSTALIYGYHS